MNDSQRTGERDAVASLTVARNPDSITPEVKDILAALRSLYPGSRFAIEHRALAIEDKLQIVFEVFDRDTSSASSGPQDDSASGDGGWPF